MTPSSPIQGQREFSRRRFVLGTGALAAIMTAHSGRSQSSSTLTPEMFGAKGDGRTNDSAAFAALAARINALGGGEIDLKNATYVVGMQRQAFASGADYAFEPAKLMEFVGCSKPLIIRGNGARIKCAAGLRFGTFDPRSGVVVHRKSPNYQKGELSSPYFCMIKVERCTGPIAISDLELDGSLNELLIGGPWGDTGHQLSTFGLGLFNNAGREVVRNLYTHHHAVDGLIVDGPDHDRGVISLFENIRSEYNARQGCSIVGGYGYRFVDCHFNHTGRGAVASAPGAGVDAEAEGKKIRNLDFENCEFSNNTGAGMLAVGDVERATFKTCSFIGTTSWAAWPPIPWGRFDGCRFVGPIVWPFGDAVNPERATKFHDCTFRDDPALTPTGKVYLGTNTDGPIADLSNNPNVAFNRCSFLLTHDHVLPWATNGVQFIDCTMRQRSPKASYPRGTYLGRGTIVGRVDLYAARIWGDLTVNGVRVPRTARS